MRQLRRASVLAIFALLCFRASGAVSIQIGLNFSLSTFQVDSTFQPPDSDGAIGPNHFVQLINGRYSVYNKTTGARVQSITSASFWTAAGVTFPSGVEVSDPRIIFDKSVNRWFASAIDVNVNTLVSNRFLVAVSVTSDPTGTWKAVAFQADPAGNLADFPTLGLDANGVYLGGNMFNGSGALVGQLLVSIPKADLLQSTPSAARRSTTGVVPISSYGFTLQPVVNFSPTNSAENVIAVDSDGTDFIAHSNLVHFQVVGSATSSATFTSPADVSIPPYSVPLDPPQPDGKLTLSDGDSRIGAISYQVGNIIYAVHSSQGSHADIQWFKISAVDGSVLQTGIISDPNLDLFYPSIAANDSGIVVIGVNGCSSNSFVSSYALVGETINAVTTFGNLILLKAGVANFEVLDTAGESRWGDYSATSVDPSDPTSFWTIQEYVSANNVWSTEATQLRVTIIPPPSLQIAAANTNVVVSWPTNAAGFALQSTTNVAGGVWASVTNSVSISGTQNVVTVMAGVPAQYFRLKK